MSKADEQATPTEEQVKDANAAEDARWQDDTPMDELKIPYKREEGDDAKSDDPKGDDGKVADNGDDNDKSASEADEEYEEPAPLVTVQDPGDYKPADYSFEVTLAEGKKVTIKNPEEADKLAEDPENFETPAQLSDFLRKQMKMERNLDRDKERYDEQKAKFDDQTEAEEKRQDQISNYANEFAYLVDKGQLPEIDAKYKDADWSDPEVAKQPGVKEQLALLSYMVKENKARTKAKVSPLTSVVDAFNSWQLDSGRKKEEAAAKKAGEERKAAGAKVAGVSPSSQGTFAPKGIAVGDPNKLKRTASIWDD